MITRIEPYGSLLFSKEEPTTIRMNRRETREFLGYRGDFPEDLTAPEVVHLEISNRCDKDCEYCYVEKDREELDESEWKEIILELSRNGITQVTFGGGEPFMRKDIFELASLANEEGMGTAVTTNGEHMPEKKEKLSVFDQVNFSYHGEIKGEEILESLKHTKAGINFVYSKRYKEDLNRVSSFCKEKGVELLILSYKPVMGDDENVIEPEKTFRKAKSLAEKGVSVAMDGMTCNRCTASERFVDICSEGYVYPCSFIREPMGNVLEEPFAKIWGNRNIPSECPYS